MKPKKYMIRNTLLLLTWSLVLIILSCSLSPKNSHGKIVSTGSNQPEVLLPKQFEKMHLSVIESDMEIPGEIDSHLIPIGKIYDITLDNKNNTFNFGDDYARLVYKYNKSELLDNGLIETFKVYYFDNNSNTWKLVNKTEVDRENCTVIAYTNHFTPFVLTALSDPWIMVGNNVTYDPQKVTPPSKIAFNGTVPYVAWREGSEATGYDKIYAKKWNGVKWERVGNNSIDDPYKPSWAFNFSFNKTTPYVVWTEMTGTHWEIFVKYFDGDKWVPVGGCIYSESGLISSVMLTFVNSIPYVTWDHYKKGTGQVFVKYWDGTNWVFLGNSLNVDAQKDAQYPVIANFKNSIYVAWVEHSEPQANYQLYVKKWDGNNWIQIGSILNVDKNKWIDGKPSIAVSKDSIYVAWAEAGATHETPHRIYVKYLNNNNWTLVGDCINVNNMYHAHDPSLIIVRNKPYIAWAENSGEYAGQYSELLIFVKHWDDKNWIQDGDSLNVDRQNVALSPMIGYNGSTIFVAFQECMNRNNEGFFNIYVKAGNWDEPIVDKSIPLITKFELTSKSATADRIVTFNLEGTDDKGITGWMITGSDVQPFASNFNWQSEKPTQCEVGTNTGKTQLYIWAKDDDGNVSEVSNPIEVDFYNVSMETASNQYYGSGTFGEPSKPLTKDDYPLMTPLFEGIDYAYNSALNNADNQGYSIYDPNDWLNFDSGKYFRIVENGKNVTATDGLHLTPIAKNLENIDKSFPPKNEVWVDPARSRFVFPRPRYFDKFDDEIIKSNNLILTNAILSDENTKIIEFPYANGLLNGTYAITTSNEGKFNKCLQLSTTSHYCRDYTSWDRMHYAIYPCGSIPKNHDSGTISFWHYSNGDFSSPNQVATYGGFTVFFYTGSIEVPSGSEGVFTFEAGLFSGVALSNTSIPIRAYIYGSKTPPVSKLALSDTIFVSRNKWHHYYLIWDVNRRLGNNTKTIRLFVDGSEVISMNNHFNSSNFTCMISIVSGAYNDPPEFTGISKIDNLKFWDYVVSEDSSWEYNNGYGNENGLHSMYKNGGIPTLNVENNSGVGYYKGQ